MTPFCDAMRARDCASVSRILYPTPQRGVAVACAVYAQDPNNGTTRPIIARSGADSLTSTEAAAQTLDSTPSAPCSPTKCNDRQRDGIKTHTTVKIRKTPHRADGTQSAPLGAVGVTSITRRDVRAARRLTSPLGVTGGRGQAPRDVTLPVRPLSVGERLSHAVSTPMHRPTIFLGASGRAVIDAEIDRLLTISGQLEQLMNAGAATAADVERAVQVNHDLQDLLETHDA